MSDVPRFVDEHHLRVGSYDFHCQHPIGHVPHGRIPVEKRRELVEDYIALCADLQPKRIVEIGVYRGGSAVLMSELVGPEKLVAIELNEAPVPVLDDYIEARGLAAVVRPYLGVDQSDRARVGEIVQAEFGGAPIDLVIDDASHLYDETRSSFESLFPFVAPGGTYLLEDWRWQHQVADAAGREDAPAHVLAAVARRMEDVAAGRVEPTVPMSRLAVELLLARASSGDAVAELTVGPYWVGVRRGHVALEPGAFRVDELVRDHFHQITPAP